MVLFDGYPNTLFISDYWIFSLSSSLDRHPRPAVLRTPPCRLFRLAEHYHGRYRNKGLVAVLNLPLPGRTNMTLRGGVRIVAQTVSFEFFSRPEERATRGPNETSDSIEIIPFSQHQWLPLQSPNAPAFPFSIRDCGEIAVSRRSANGGASDLETHTPAATVAFLLRVYHGTVNISRKVSSIWCFLAQRSPRLKRVLLTGFQNCLECCIKMLNGINRHLYTMKVLRRAYVGALHS